MAERGAGRTDGERFFRAESFCRREMEADRLSFVDFWGCCAREFLAGRAAALEALLAEARREHEAALAAFAPLDHPGLLVPRESRLVDYWGGAVDQAERAIAALGGALWEGEGR